MDQVKLPLSWLAVPSLSQPGAVTGDGHRAFKMPRTRTTAKACSCVGTRPLLAGATRHRGGVMAGLRELWIHQESGPMPTGKPYKGRITEWSLAPFKQKTIVIGLFVDHPQLLATAAVPATW